LLYVQAVSGGNVLSSGTVAAGTTVAGSAGLTIDAITVTRDITIQWSADNTNWTDIVTFTQYNSIAPRFARSNIVWTGEILTFAENDNRAANTGTTTVTAADGKTYSRLKMPSNSQGVFFQWGSLVAISPAALSGTTTTYTAGRASTGTGHIVYDPTNNYAYAYASIPYINSTAAPFNNNITTEDDFATYNGGQGWDNNGRGDICRYISSQGWVSGNWRLPTADEYDQLLAELLNGVSNNGGFTNINVTPNNASKSYHYGYYQPLSGRWLGTGTSTSSGVENPTTGAYFPAGGYRYADGTASNVGDNGYYWSGSSGSTPNGYLLRVNSSGANRTYYTRQYAYPVRCVRE
ncbi:hypothetical protein LJC38_01835, partial [Parabacteroides sp. OttesenSCG-928-K15]|nr:hypothetical protein [Parabacteroides sp. OttesenSCG-928-K15]